MKKTTLNWRIRKPNEDFFFIEADLPNAEVNGHYPTLEVMQEDFGDHNGYTKELRLADAELIVKSPKMLRAIEEVLEVLTTAGTPNIKWIELKLKDSIL